MRPETILQRAILKRLSALGFLPVHIPNGATLKGDKRQRQRQMANLKADGLMPGMPDLIVYGSEGRVGHIEVKTPTGRLQPTQKNIQVFLTNWGHLYAICRSEDDVDAALRAWGWA